MSERLKRWTAWAGGPWTLAAIVAVQLVAVMVFAMEPKVALGIVLAVVGAVVVLDRPILGVGLLISARLLSTGATVFMRVGRMGIGPFEPVYCCVWRLWCFMPRFTVRPCGVAGRGGAHCWP